MCIRDSVTGVQSYARTVGSAIPPAYVGEEVTDQFYSAHYARFILTLDTEPEGTQAFETVSYTHLDVYKRQEITYA